MRRLARIGTVAVTRVGRAAIDRQERQLRRGGGAPAGPSFSPIFARIPFVGLAWLVGKDS